jgi:hypothetical protein
VVGRWEQTLYGESSYHRLRPILRWTACRSGRRKQEIQVTVPF